MLDAPVDDLMLAAVSETADTELAFSDGRRCGAPIPLGPVTLSQIWNLLPTDPPVGRAEPTGAEIWQ